MLEENKIVDQAQQVMEKLCTIAKTNCEKHFIADQKKKRKMYTQEKLKEHIREKWTSELVTTTQIRKFLTAVNTVTEKVNAYKLEKTDDYDTLPVELQAQIKYLKVKFAYQIGRNRSKSGNPVEDFEKEARLMSLIDGIKSSTKEYEKFTPTCETNEIQKCSNEQLVNTYDNGILYIDNFLNKVIKTLEKEPNWESTMFYVSDHGESLGEDGIYLHAAPYAIAPIYQTRVPMVMWLSPMWIKNEGFDLDCLRKNAETQEYSHDNYFHTVFSMMDTKNDEKIYDKKLDILAQCKMEK